MSLALHNSTVPSDEDFVGQSSVFTSVTSGLPRSLAESGTNLSNAPIGVSALFKSRLINGRPVGKCRELAEISEPPAVLVLGLEEDSNLLV